MGILQGQGGRPTAQCQRTWVALAAALVCASVGAQEAATTATATTLSEVVVSAAGFEQEIKEAPASISVMSREQLKEKLVSDLAEALEGVEGMDVWVAPAKPAAPTSAFAACPAITR